jgi:hypothetical protein
MALGCRNLPSRGLGLEDALRRLIDTLREPILDR